MIRREIAMTLQVSICITGLILAAGCSGKRVQMEVASPRGGSKVKSLTPPNLKPYSEVTLSNGLQVLLVEDRELPSFSIGLILKDGAAAEDPNFKGVASLTARLLSRGAGKKSAIELSEDLGLLGTSFEAMVDYDATFLSASTLSSRQNELIALFAEVLTKPAFDPAEIKKVKQMTVAQLESRVDSAQGFASELFERYLYGTHPYGEPTSGRVASVKEIGRKEILQHYLKFYRPNRAILTLVGRYSPDVIKVLEEALKDWKVRAEDSALSTEIPVVRDEKPGLRLVVKDDLNQAQIRIGHPGVPRNHPDYLKLRVLSTILGGGFSSRLMDQVRDNLGLTYTIGASFDSKRTGGAFQILSFTKNETVGRLLTEVKVILKKMVDEGVQAEELNRARQYMIGRFPQTIETGEKLALNLGVLRVYGISDDYLIDFKENLEALSVKGLNEALRKHFHPDQLKILVLGQKAGLIDQLKLVSEVELKTVSEMK
ncbi:MAG: insulinase family protein [Bdellovibrionales bacterium]|nr:insulinase family protein [Bdellovibrionales bacterium]